MRARYIGVSGPCMTQGKVYEVKQYGIGNYHLIDDEGDSNRYYQGMFEIVEDTRAIVKHVLLVELEEWAAYCESQPAAEFMWRVVGAPEPLDSSWFRTGVVRKLEVPIQDLVDR